MEIKRLEVRCCCNPNKVLGHLTHPRLQQRGDVWWFMVSERAPGVPGIIYNTKRLELQVSEFSDGRGVRHTAVKNNDYALEDLKLVPGFEPATWEPGS